MQIRGDFYQIGVVVRDLELGMDHYRQLLGLGPFMELKTNYRARCRDWEGNIVNYNAFTKWGPLYVEIVEPGSGQSSALEWLETHGEGIFHLAYASDDLSQRPEGVECCFESFGATLANGDAAIVYLDTVEQLGYFVELTDLDVVTQFKSQVDRYLAQSDKTV